MTVHWKFIFFQSHINVPRFIVFDLIHFHITRYFLCNLSVKKLLSWYKQIYSKCCHVTEIIMHVTRISLHTVKKSWHIKFVVMLHPFTKYNLKRFFFLIRSKILLDYHHAMIFLSSFPSHTANMAGIHGNMLSYCQLIFEYKRQCYLFKSYGCVITS